MGNGEWAAGIWRRINLERLEFFAHYGLAIHHYIFANLPRVLCHSKTVRTAGD